MSSGPWNKKRRIETFAEDVDKRSHDECWEYIPAKGTNNYGRIGIGQGHCVSSHRYAYELFFGPVPRGKMVLHKCGNKSCVNPYHLYLGSCPDNAVDAVDAGTHGGFMQRKLSDGSAGRIRQLLDEGKTQWDIAKMFGVSQSLIYKIKKGSPCYPVKQEGTKI